MDLKVEEALVDFGEFGGEWQGLDGFGKLALCMNGWAAVCDFQISVT